MLHITEKFCWLIFHIENAFFYEILNTKPYTNLRDRTSL